MPALSTTILGRVRNRIEFKRCALANLGLRAPWKHASFSVAHYSTWQGKRFYADASTTAQRTPYTLYRIRVYPKGDRYGSR